MTKTKMIIVPPVGTETKYKVVFIDGKMAVIGAPFIISRDVTEATTLLTDNNLNEIALNSILSRFKASVRHETTGELVYYLDSTSPLLKDDGATASDLTGTDGMVMIEKPGFWIKEWVEGDEMFFALSLRERTGYRYSPPYAFGKYKGYRNASNRLVSWSGVTPTTYRRIYEFRADARLNRGNEFTITPYHIYYDLMLLYMAKEKNLNAQYHLGYVSNASNTDWNNFNASYPVWDTGQMNDKETFYCGSKDIVIPNFVGGIADLETEAVSFMGIEDFYGHIWEFLDGLALFYTDSGVGTAYKCQNYNQFADGSDAGGAPPTGYESVGALTASGYVKEMHPGEIIPKTTGGTGVGSDTYYCDYHYASTSAGWRVALVGGRLNLGDYSGPFYLYFTYSSAIRYAYSGARLGLYL